MSAFVWRTALNECVPPVDAPTERGRLRSSPGGKERQRQPHSSSDVCRRERLHAKKEIGEEKRKKCQGRGMDPDWTELTGDGEGVSDDAEGGPSETECAHGVIAPGDPTGRGGAVTSVSDWGQGVVLRGLSFGFRGVDGERDGGVDGDLVSGHWGRGRGERWTVWLLLDDLRGVCHVRVAVRKSRNPSRESTNCRMKWRDWWL